MGTLIPLDFSERPSAEIRLDDAQWQGLIYADFRRRSSLGRYRRGGRRYRLASEMLLLKEEKDTSALLLTWFDFHKVVGLEGQLLLTDWLRPIRHQMNHTALRAVVSELAQNQPGVTIPRISSDEAGIWDHMGHRGEELFGIDLHTIKKHYWSEFGPSDKDEVTVFNHLWTLFLVAVRVFRMSHSTS